MPCFPAWEIDKIALCRDGRAPYKKREGAKRTETRFAPDGCSHGVLGPKRSYFHATHWHHFSSMCSIDRASYGLEGTASCISQESPRTRKVTEQTSPVLLCSPGPLLVCSSGQSHPSIPFLPLHEESGLGFWKIGNLGTHPCRPRFAYSLVRLLDCLPTAACRTWYTPQQPFRNAETKRTGRQGSRDKDSTEKECGCGLDVEEQKSKKTKRKSKKKRERKEGLEPIWEFPQSYTSTKHRSLVKRQACLCLRLLLQLTDSRQKMELRRTAEQNSPVNQKGTKTVVHQISFTPTPS